MNLAKVKRVPRSNSPIRSLTIILNKQQAREVTPVPVVILCICIEISAYYDTQASIEG